MADKALAGVEVLLGGDMSEPSRWMLEATEGFLEMTGEMRRLQSEDLEAAHSVRGMSTNAMFLEDSLRSALAEGATHSAVLMYTVDLMRGIMGSMVDEALLALSDATGGLQDCLDDLAKRLVTFPERTELWADPMPWSHGFFLPWAYNPETEGWEWSWPWEGKTGRYVSGGAPMSMTPLVDALGSLVECTDDLPDLLPSGSKATEAIGEVAKRIGYLNRDPVGTTTHFVVNVVKNMRGFKQLVASGGR